MSYVKKFRSSSYAVFAALVAGTMMAAGISVWATSVGTNVTVTGTMTVESATATSTFGAGGINVASGQFIVEQTNGRIGIATTSPYGLLSIEQNSLENIFVIGDTGTSSPSFVVLGNGNSGFGTTTPISRLSVQGNALISATTTTGGLIATGTALLAQNGGLVGIATVTPSQSLSVGGSVFIGASSGGGTIGGLGVGVATTTAGAFEITGDALFGDTAADRVMFGAGDIRLNNIGTTTISQANVAGWSFATSTSPAPLLRFDTANTRIGVATGTPTATFTVKGDTYTTGGLRVGEGQATTTPGVIETASSTSVSLFQSDVSIMSAGTSTLRIRSAGTERRACIELTGIDGTFALYATTTGPLIVNSGPCE